MRFLVKESFIAPPTPELMELFPAEQSRVGELVAAGIVEAAYAAADNTAMWMVWNVESQNALDTAHKTLPLHDYLQSEIALQADQG